MTSTIKAIVELLSTLLKGVLGFFFWNSGRKSERLNNAKNTMEDVVKGNLAASTDEYDDELQERYNK